jgi:hypothetical protein
MDWIQAMDGPRERVMNGGGGACGLWRRSQSAPSRELVSWLVNLVS